jgi:hypothetical protein
MDTLGDDETPRRRFVCLKTNCYISDPVLDETNKTLLYLNRDARMIYIDMRVDSNPPSLHAVNVQFFTTCNVMVPGLLLTDLASDATIGPHVAYGHLSPKKIRSENRK